VRLAHRPEPRARRRVRLRRHVAAAAAAAMVRREKASAIWGALRVGILSWHKALSGLDRRSSIWCYQKGVVSRGTAPGSNECGKSQPLRVLYFSLSPDWTT